MVSIRQEVRPGMTRFMVGCIKRSDRCGLAARRRDAIKRAPEIRRKNDHTILVPGASPARLRIGYRLGRTTRDCDSFWFSSGKEAYRPTISRPERLACIPRAGERLGVERI